jgi:hypothetical protein
MRPFLRGKVTLLFMMLGLLLAVPAVALADQIGNNLDAVIDATVEETSVQLGGPAGSDTKTVGYLISPEGPGVDGDPGCNLDGSTEKLVANVTSSDASVATVSPSQVTFSGPGCGSTPSVTVTGKTPGTATITLTESSNNTGGTFGYSGATFQVNVDRATSITNVSGEGTEGGTATLKATLNSLYSNTAADPGPDETAGTVAGKDIEFFLNGISQGTATTGANGVAEKTINLPATFTASGSPYSGAVSAKFARVAGYAASGPVSGNLTVNPACTNPNDPVFQNTTPNGNNGWFTSTPTVSATSSTSGAVVKYSDAADGTYSTTAPTLGEGTTTVFAKAFSSTGTCSSAAVSHTYKVDTIAPDVNPASVVNSVWRNTDLSQAFTASDNGSGLATPADASFTLTASAESLDTNTPTVVSKTVSDLAGNSTTRSVSAKIDKTNPEISGQDVNDTTWRNTDLSQSFTASDALSGLANTADANFTLTTSGESPNATTPVTASKTVDDQAGNSATRSISALVDKTKPSLGVNDPNTATSFNVCDADPVQPTTNPTDALSGILAGSLNTSWVNNTAPSGLGSFTYSASVKDKALNEDTYGPKTYNVGPGSAYSGILQPINASATRSSFKLGSTVPVKFTLSCNGTPITNSVAKLYLAKQDASGDPVNEPIATNSPDIGNQFRVTDQATGQYQFNLSTKAGYVVPGPNGGTVSMSEGTWTLFIQLDGLPKFQAATFDIKK